MPAINEARLAEQYGWALSLLKSDASLYAVFKQAVAGTWTADQFVAKLKSTSWWKKNAESVRQYKFLQANDPATFAARKNALRAQINDQASAMGATMSVAQLNMVTEHALMFNWNESQLRDTLASYTRAVNGVYRGQAGNDADSLKQMAWRNGISLSSQTLQSWVSNIASGNATVDYYKQMVRNQAKTLAPGYSQELDSGMDLYDIAGAYIQSKAKILELNPADVDLFDPDVRSALSSKDSNGKPATKSLWQFEQDLRRKPEWLKTQGAQDQVMQTGRQVLRDFGFMGV